MATNYKIRLKRFNGVDFDTLNLLSENIIMNTGNTLQNDVIPNSNGLLKNNSGVFQIAEKGADYGALCFTVTLTGGTTAWANNEQTVSNVNFITSGYAYTVSPASSSFSEYGQSIIYADNVTVTGEMTFHCTVIPTNNLTVNIKREVSA